MRITLNDRDRRRFAALREVQELNAAVLELYSRYLNQAPCAVTADEVRELSDGWTVITNDGGLSAHYENTIALTENGIIVLTKI